MRLIRGMVGRVLSPFLRQSRSPGTSDAQVMAAFDAVLKKMAHLHRDTPDEEIEADLAEARRERRKME